MESHTDVRSRIKIHHVESTHLSVIIDDPHRLSDNPTEVSSVDEVIWICTVYPMLYRSYDRYIFRHTCKIHLLKKLVLIFLSIRYYLAMKLSMRES